MRNYGSSVGVSLTVAYVVRQTQSSQSILTERVSPFNETLRHISLPDAWSMTDLKGVASLSLEASRQASVIAYNNDFIWLVFTLSLIHI